MSKIIKQILPEIQDDDETAESTLRLRLIEKPLEKESGVRPEESETTTPSEPTWAPFDIPEIPASLEHGIRAALKTRGAQFGKKSKEAKDAKENSAHPKGKRERILHGVTRRNYAPVLAALIVAAGVGAYLTKESTPLAIQMPEPTIPTQLSVGANPSLVLANHDAVVLFRKQKYEDALKVLKALVQQYPDFSGLYVNLAAVEMKLGDRKVAKKHLEQALKLDPKNATALNNLGTLNLADKKWVIAQENFKRALEVNPSLEDTRLNYAKSLELGGAATNAIQQYELYIAHAGTDPIFGNLLKKRVLKLKSMAEYMRKKTETQ